MRFPSISNQTNLLFVVPIEDIVAVFRKTPKDQKAPEE